MTRRFPVRTLTMTGLLLAVGLLLPIVFHSLFGAAGGKMFLPMHYAVLLGGLLLGPVAGAFLGIATPLLSTLLSFSRADASSDRLRTADGIRLSTHISRCPRCMRYAEGELIFRGGDTCTK